MGSSRIVAIPVAIVLAAFFAAYVWSPFRAAAALGQAVRDGDRDSLSIQVDFPSVRESLKDQFVAQLVRQTDNKAFKKNPLIGLALMFLPTIANRIVDAVVTPDGIIALLSRPMGGRSGRGQGKTKWNHNWHFIDLGHFKTEYSEANEPSITFGLLFERRGIFTWKLVRLDVPTDELAKRMEQSSDEGRADAGGATNAAAEQNGALPGRVGGCSIVTVKQVGTRLQDADGTPVPGSGSAIAYADGGSQVSYDTIDGIDHSKPGDAVRLCLVSIPERCPPGDSRGRIYAATNLRTHEQWTAADSEHSCGGA